MQATIKRRSKLSMDGLIKTNAEYFTKLEKLNERINKIEAYINQGPRHQGPRHQEEKLSDQITAIGARLDAYAKQLSGFRDQYDGRLEDLRADYPEKKTSIIVRCSPPDFDTWRNPNGSKHEIISRYMSSLNAELTSRSYDRTRAVIVKLEIEKSKGRIIG